MYGGNQAERRQPVRNRIVVRFQLNVVARVEPHLHQTDDWRPMARLVGKRKRRDRIECGEDIALPRNQGSAKGWIKIVLSCHPPAQELLRLTICRLAEKPLGDTRFDLARIRNRVLLIEADNPAKVVNS